MGSCLRAFLFASCWKLCASEESLLELKETWFNKDLNASGDQCLKDGKKSGLGYFGT